MNETLSNAETEEEAILHFHDLSMDRDESIASVGRILKKYQQNIVDDLIEEQKKTGIYIATNTLVHLFSSIAMNFAANAARGHPDAAAGIANGILEGFNEISPDEIKQLDEFLKAKWDGSAQQQAFDQFAKMLGTSEQELTEKQREQNENAQKTELKQ